MLFRQRWWTVHLSTLPHRKDWLVAGCRHGCPLRRFCSLHRGALRTWPFWGSKTAAEHVQNQWAVQRDTVLVGTFKNLCYWLNSVTDLDCLEHPPGVCRWVTDGPRRLFLGDSHRPSVLDRRILMDCCEVPRWVPSGAGRCLVSCAWSVSAVPGRWSYWHNWLISSFPDLRPMEHFSSTITSTTEQHNTPQTFQELIDGQIRVW